MRPFLLKLVSILALLLLFGGCGGQIGDVSRHARLTASTVRVWVDGTPAGSGFVVDSSGLVATNYHVVMAKGEWSGDGEMPGVSGEIEVELSDGRRLAAEAVSCVEHSDLWLSRSKDFAVLKVQADGLVALPLGSFADVSEGTPICLVGFPLGINQPIVGSGFLSTKWLAPAEFGHSGTREVAWLDATMNRGNSGGPVVALGRHPDDDRVIGIATFQLNPFAARAERIARAVSASGSDLVVPGFSVKELALLTGEALSHNSLGVGGCVSADYLAKWLRERPN